MIRVVIRHIDAADGILVGDFASTEIDDLLALFRQTPIHNEFTETSDYVRLATDLADGPTQFVIVDGATPRLVLEVIVEDIPT